MCEGDWGIALPISISGVTFTENDKLVLVIKSKVDGDVLVTKTFEYITENTVQLVLTEADAALLPVGKYAYFIDWYQDDAFLCNLVPEAEFRVVNKA